MKYLREGIPNNEYLAIERSFKRLWGYPDNIQPDSEVEGIPYLTEKNFMKNIKFVIGVDCPYFGKILYLYFAKGYDKAKITMARFFEGLKPYVNEDEKSKHN